MIRALLRANTPSKETRDLLAACVPGWLRPGRALLAGVLLLLVSVMTLTFLAGVVAAEPAPNPCGDRGTGGNACADNNEPLKERKKEREEAEANKSPTEKFEDRVQEYKDEARLSKGVLGAFDVVDRDGNPVSIYQVHADTGDWMSWDLKARHFLVEMLFQINIWLVAFACWLISWALSFSLAAIFLKPVIAVSNSLHSNLIMQMGLASLFLTFAMVVASWHWMFGVKARGWGEAAAALLISALAATVLVSPVTLLLDEQEGAVGKAQQLSAEVAALILDGVEGPKERAPGEEEAAERDYYRNGQLPDTPKITDLPEEISRPITDALVDAFIARPAMLLSYGQVWEGTCATQFREQRARQAVYEDMIKEEQDKRNGPIGRWLEDQLDKIPGIGGFLSEKQSQSMQEWRELTSQDISQDDAWKELESIGPIEGFEDSCVEGSAQAAKRASPEKIGGAVFLLFAALLAVAFIVLSVGTYLNAQVWLAVEAALAKAALVVGVAPGPGRAWLWSRLASIGRWLAMLVLAVAALALFIVIIVAVITASEEDLPGGIVVRFVVIDVVAVAMFMFRKRLLATAGRLASRAQTRLGNSNLGGQTLTSPMDSAGGRGFAAAAFLSSAPRGRSAARWGSAPRAGGSRSGLGSPGRPGRGGLIRSGLGATAGTAGVVAQGVGMVSRGARHAARTSTDGTARGMLRSAAHTTARRMPSRDVGEFRERLEAMRHARVRPPARPGDRRPGTASGSPSAPAPGAGRLPRSRRRTAPATTPTPTPAGLSRTVPGRTSRSGAHDRLRAHAHRMRARRATRSEDGPTATPRRPRGGGL